MIAPYGHGGGDRILAQMDITKGDAGLSSDKSALVFSAANPVAQTVTVLNAYASVMPSAAWKTGSNKFDFAQTSQSGTTDDGQTVYTITPKSGAVAGDNDVLIVTAGGLSVEIPVVVYDPTDISLPVDLTSGGSVADAAKVIGMVQTATNASYDMSSKTLNFISHSTRDTKRTIILHFSDVPSKLSFTTVAASSSNQPRWYVYQSADATNWGTALVNGVREDGTKDHNDLALNNNTRYIKFEYDKSTVATQVTNLKITKLDPTPAFTLVSSQDWGSQSVNKSVAKNIAPTGLNEAATISTWSAELSGTDADMFAVTSCDASTGACVITYTPTEAGLHSATLTLTATNNTASPAVVTSKTIALSGTGDAAATIELTKQGEVTPSTSHDFGSVIGLNAATDLMLNVFASGVEGELTYEWTTLDATFTHSVTGSQITIHAQPTTAQVASSQHTGVLTVKGKITGTNEYVSKDYTVTLTITPRIVPSFTWNIEETLYAESEYSNIYTTNTDATMSVVISDPQLLQYQNNKLITNKLTSAPPQLAGTITCETSQTDTYEAINKQISITLLANPRVLPLIIDSESKFNALYSGTNLEEEYKPRWNADEGAIEIPRRSGSYNTERYAEITFVGTPYQLSFEYKNDEEVGGQYAGNVVFKVQESADGKNWTTIMQTNPGGVDQFTSYGPFELSNTTTKLRFSHNHTDASVVLKNVTVISASPTLNVTETSLDLKANNTQVYDNSIHFSVLKYSTIKAKIEGADFGLIKGDADAASEITFTSADGLNDATFTDCTFKVHYSGTVDGSIGKIASVKFYDGNDNQLGSAVDVSIIAVPILTFEAPANGSYTYKYGNEDAVTVNETKTRDLATAPYEVTLTATPASGYKFFAWYEKNGDTKTYLSTATPYTPSISTTKTIGAEFISSTTPVFMVKGQEGAYLNLNDACSAAASSSSKIVVLADDGTLAAGNYTIPAGVTLLIPFDDNNTVTIDHNSMSIANVAKAYNASRTCYRKLTLVSGVVIDIYGNLNVGANLASASGGSLGCGSINTHYGRIDMLSGSKINLKNGANLYCWGIISGTQGLVTAENSSKVHEMFQHQCNPGGTKASQWDRKAFFMNQFYIQNIEAPLKLEYGAKEKVYIELYIQGYQNINTTLIGNDGLFRINDASSYLIKTYDPTNDRIIYDLYGNASIASLSMSVYGQSLDTKNQPLPINNNMTIACHTNGSPSTISVAYDVDLLPSAKIIIDKDVTANVVGKLNIYDRDEWYGKGYAQRDLYDIARASFSPTRTHNRTIEEIEDATLEINGQVNVSGGLFTSAGKANVCSAGNGVINLINLPAATNKAYQYSGNNINSGIAINLTAAQLKNNDGSYTQTAKCLENTTFGYKDGNWLAYVPAPADPAKDTTIVVEEGEEIVIKDESQMDHIDTIKVADGGNVVIETDITTPVIVEDGGNVVIEADITTPVIVEEGGTLNVEEEVEVESIALSTTPSAIDIPEEGQGSAGTSSQITGSGTITAANVFIDITMDPSGKLDGSKYYAFAVPFAVNVNGGVQKKIGNQLSPCVHNTHFRAYTYNGANRAANGKGSNWVLVNTATFQPGVFYLVEFADGSCNTFRFTKASGEDLNNAANITLAENGNGVQDSPDAGWNGIANNSLQNASISLTSTGVAQIFDPAQNAFVTINLGNTLFAIGTPLFVQVGAAGVTANNSAVAHNTNAPARMLAQTDDETFGNYTVRIKAEGATKMADQMFISASENAESSYVIGKDLTKMFMGNAAVAQLWVNDYGKKLSMNQAVLVDNVAETSLTLYAPKAGNYEVYLKDIPEDATIYLLENGEAIAALNDGAFSVTLAKGENTQYGLRINAIKTTPGVVTSIDEALVGGDLQKVLLDGVVYIVRDGKLFTVLGQER